MGIVGEPAFSQAFRLRCFIGAMLLLTPCLSPQLAAAEAADFSLFLENHCVECHGDLVAEAKLDLQSLPPLAEAPENAQLWQEVVDRLTLGDMPPADAFQPDPQEKLAVIETLRAELTRLNQSDHATSKNVLRRLNRQEYNNTMRDLTGLDLRLGDDFPADIAVDGFDNIGEALTVSPYLMEQYMHAAQQWLDEAIRTERPQTEYLKLYGWRGGMGGVDLEKYRHPLSFAELSPEEQEKKRNAGRHVSVYITKSEWNYIAIPHTGRYRFRLLLSGYRSTEQQPMPRVQFVVASGPVASLTITSPVGKRGEPQWYEFDAWLPAGVLNFRGEFLNPEPKQTQQQRKGKADDYQATHFYEHWSEIRGPLYETWPPESTQRILPPELIDEHDEPASARRVLRRFMQLAWRRPVAKYEVQPMVELFRQTRPHCESFEEAIKTPLVAVLTSPHFLYLVEPQLETDRQPLDDYELASRLSYFLWSSTPDETLFELAEAGKLSDSAVLVEQMQRMLEDPKVEAFAANFVGQWLRLRSLGSTKPDPQHFPNYNPWLEQSMRVETHAFFEELIDRNESVLNFIDSDFTLLNDELASHYGISGIEGGEFRRVSLSPESLRGGVLTQASILTLTADGHETSPIHRGTWILESFLNTPPPPPPPNVPELEAVEKHAAEPLRTIREKLRAHRGDPACAGCHSKIDPLGFALETFDPVGVQRPYVDKPQDVPVESFGELPGGIQFDGPQQFKQVLLEHRRDVFLRGLTTNMMTYALGRPVGFADRKQIEEIVSRLVADEYRIGTLLASIVSSDAFRLK